MDNKYLLSDNPLVVAGALSKAIIEDRNSQSKKQARTGQLYYDYEHDILRNRVFFIDDNDKLQEDTNASNVKIPHAFFTEQVDQKVQYLLSNPIEIETEEEELKKALEEYYDDDMLLFLQEAVEGSSIKGHEYIFARTNNLDRLCFQVSDSIQTFEVQDENGDTAAIVRYYDKDVTVDGRNKTLTHAEVWNAQEVHFYVKDKNDRFALDAGRDINPRPHVVATTEEGEMLERSYGTIPFYRLSNNRKELTDLAPIKPLIDDYDLMACYLSNNLQDFAEAIYVVKGFKGDNLSKLRQNIKSKKTVGVGSDGGVDIKTVDIPVAARQAKLDIDKDAIYKFGMGFDSTQIGDGNITNVVIKSRYALLDMKANKAEVRLKALLLWINNLIIEDINRRSGKSFKVSDVKMKLIRETMVNENDIVNRAKIEAETQQVIIQTILAAAPRLDDGSTLKLICEQFELDYEEIEKLIEEQDYTADSLVDDDPLETITTDPEQTKRTKVDPITGEGGIIDAAGQVD